MEERNKQDTPSMVAPRICSRCGTVVSAYGPEGLCPKCLLLGGLAAEEERDRRTSETDARTHLRYFGDYELFEEIAHGGMGVVYKARQTSLNRVVAVKVLLYGRFSTPEFVQRFRAEAGAAASLQHPNIVAIHEVGEHEGQHYFSMDYVEGQSLAEMVRNEPLPTRQAAQYLKTIAEAVHYAHQHGILHRDLKPSNILIDQSGQPRITDFGLAKRVESGDTAGSRRFQRSTQEPLNSLTVTGQVLGSPAYMPPEQAAGRHGELSPASDVYSLGAVLFHLLTGRPPFVAQSIPETLRQVVDVEPISPRVLNPSVPLDLETICLKCLEKERAHRYPNAQELADELGRVLLGEPIRARPAGPWDRLAKWVRRKPAVATLLASLLLVLALGFAGVVWQWRRAERNAAESRQRLVRLNVAQGTRFFAEDNPLASLPWLMEALRLDAGDAAKSKVHQLRVNSVLGQAPKLAQLWMHTGAVTRAAFSADGRYVITACGQLYNQRAATTEVRLFDVASGDLLARHRSPGADPKGAFALAGLRFATEDTNNMVHVLDVITGQPKGPPLPHTPGTDLLCLSPDGERLLTSRKEPGVVLWEIRTGNAVIIPMPDGNAYASTCFSPDGSRFAAGINVLRVWETATANPLTPLMPQSSAASLIVLSPDNRLLAAAAQDRAVRLWSADTGQLLVPPMPNSAMVSSLAISPWSDAIAAGGLDGYLRLWNAHTGDLLTAPSPGSQAVRSVAFSPDGRWVASGADDGVVRVADAKTGRPVVPALIHGSAVLDVNFSPDGRRLATASADGTARVWDLTTTAGQLVCDPFASAADDIEVSPDAARAARRAFGEMRVWEIERGEGFSRRLEFTGSATFAAFSANGRQIIVGNGTNALLWPADNPAASPLVLPHSQFVTNAWFGAESKALITATKEGMQRWDGASGRPLGPTRPIRGVMLATSTDAASAVTSEGTNVLVWDFRPGAPQGPTTLAHPLRVSRAAFSPDGRRLLTLVARGNPENEIPWLWNLAASVAPAVSLKLAAAERTVRAVFSPDGARFVTGSLDGTARIWDSSTGAPLAPGLRHGSPVREVAFSADGQFVATVAYEDGVRIWDAATAEPITPALNYPNIARVRFSPDNRHIIATGWSGATRLWSFAAEARPAEDWPLFAQLLSNGQLDARGGMQNLSPRALNESWQTLRARHPNVFATTKQQAEAWHREQAVLCRQAGDWFALNFHLDRLAELRPDEPRYRQQQAVAQAQLARQPGAAGGRASRLRFIPPRDPATRPQLIDLTSFYNALLIEDVHPASNGAIDTGNDLAQLPVGIQELGGVEFDVRGVIKLAGRVFAARGAHYPEAVREIPVKRPSRKLHLLHGTGYGVDDGDQIGSVILKYADGAQAGFPIIYGQHVFNWWRPPNLPELASNTVVAWKGSNKRIRRQDGNIHLYRTTWENPRPDQKIAAIDFVSDNTATGPFIIGITIEP